MTKDTNHPVGHTASLTWVRLNATEGKQDFFHKINTFHQEITRSRNVWEFSNKIIQNTIFNKLNTIFIAQLNLIIFYL